MTKKTAITELILAGAIWGFGFVATTWSLQVYTPAETLFLRFAIAFVMGFMLEQLLGYAKNKQFLFNNLLPELKLSFLPGFVLGFFMILQTIGLKSTTATNNGFITTLYVIIVPLMNQLLFKKRNPVSVYFYAAVALLGTFFLMGGNLNDINKGDLFTLFCSVVAAVHIILIGKTAHRSKSAMQFNNFQSLWGVLFMTPLLFFQPQVNLSAQWNLAFAGILFLAIGSSLVAFLIQVRTQKVLNDEIASQLFLLEAPFSFLFASLLLSETLSTLQICGAVLILLGCYLNIRTSHGMKI